MTPMSRRARQTAQIALATTAREAAPADATPDASGASSQPAAANVAQRREFVARAFDHVHEMLGQHEQLARELDAERLRTRDLTTELTDVRKQLQELEDARQRAEAARGPAPADPDGLVAVGRVLRAAGHDAPGVTVLAVVNALRAEGFRISAVRDEGKTASPAPALVLASSPSTEPPTVPATPQASADAAKSEPKE